MTRTVIFIVFSLLLSSCLSVSTINIQVLEPASDPVTPQTESVVIINRTIVDAPEVRPSSDSILEETVIESFNKTTTELVYSLAGILNEAPGISYIDTTRLLESPGTPDGEMPVPFSADFIRSINDSLNSDAVLSIEVFNIEMPDEVSMTSEQDGTGYYYIGEVKVNLSVLWRIYGLPDGDLTEEYIWFDTLNWQHAAYYTNEVLNNMPAWEEVLFESAYHTAIEFARKISPYWITVQRNLFYKGNLTIRNAANNMAFGQFGDAKTKYESLLEKRNQNVAAAAAFNLSLIYEIEGDYRLAHNWARRSYQLRAHPVTAGYIKILEERLLKADELDRQLGRKF